MNNLVTRAWAGFLFVAIFSICLYLGHYWWLSLALLMYLLSLHEYIKPKSNWIRNGYRINLIGLASIWFLVSAGAHIYYVSYFKDVVNTLDVPIPAGYIISFVLSIPLILALTVIVVRSEIKERFGALTYLYFGVFYIGFGLLSLSFLRHSALVNNMSSNQVILAFASVAGVWMSDTFAYLTGKQWGKRKLSPAISPNKSIEGLVGGMIFTAIFEIALLSIFTETTYWYIALCYGLILSLVATGGDLVQSIWKRSESLKDSGTLIPGHGGILDRIDAQLLASPFSLFFWIIINNFYL